MARYLFQELKQFCQSHRPLYIYGAGDFGRRYVHLLSCFGCEPDGFLVSVFGEEHECCGLPVHAFQEVKAKLKPPAGVILAVSEEHIVEILDEVSGVEALVFHMEDKYLRQLSWLVTHELLSMEEISAKHLALPFVPIDRDKTVWQSVLLIRFDLIGDSIEGSAFLRELRCALPHSRIVLLTRSGLEGIYRACPYLDEVLCYETDGWADMKKLSAFAKSCLQDFDTVILPRLRSATNEYTAEEMLLMLLSGARHRLAWEVSAMESSHVQADIYQGYFSRWVSIGGYMHHVQYMLAMLQDVGGIIHEEVTEAWVSEEDDLWAKDFLSRQQLPSRCILIGVGLVGSTGKKNYPPRLFAQVIEELFRRCPQLRFLCLGGHDAVEAARHLGHSDYLIDATGQTSLGQMLALSSCCSMYMGADTGLMHAAAAFGKPVVEISSELPDAKRTDIHSYHFSGPFGVPAIVCMPQKGLDGCVRECCRTVPHCITAIEPQVVAEAAWRLLNAEIFRKDKDMGMNPDLLNFEFGNSICCPSRGGSRPHSVYSKADNATLDDIGSLSDRNEGITGV